MLPVLPPPPLIAIFGVKPSPVMLKLIELFAPPLLVPVKALFSPFTDTLEVALFPVCVIEMLLRLHLPVSALLQFIKLVRCYL
jgi:hypothetical protein